MEKLNGLRKIIDEKIKTDTILFFDMDGTLIDTDYANYLAYKKAIEIVTSSFANIPFNQNERFNRGLLKKTIPNLSETIYEQIIQEKEKLYNEYLPQSRLIEFVADILIHYSKTHKTVLVTNCRKERAVLTLNYYGLFNLFSNFYFREFDKLNTRVNKFRNAITDLCISPELVIVFENEKNEIKDAINSGISKENIIIL